MHEGHGGADTSASRTKGIEAVGVAAALALLRARASRDAFVTAATQR